MQTLFETNNYLSDIETMKRDSDFHNNKYSSCKYSIIDIKMISFSSPLGYNTKKRIKSILCKIRLTNERNTL